jgi:hypothetical protein
MVVNGFDVSVLRVVVVVVVVVCGWALELDEERWKGCVRSWWSCMSKSVDEKSCSSSLVSLVFGRELRRKKLVLRVEGFEDSCWSATVYGDTRIAQWIGDSRDGERDGAKPSTDTWDILNQVCCSGSGWSCLMAYMRYLYPR